VNRRFS